MHFQILIAPLMNFRSLTEIKVAKRIAANLVIIIALFFAPWWVTLTLGIIATFYFSAYYELIVAGALFDILYGVTSDATFGYNVLGFLVTTVVFILIERIKKELR